MVAFTVILDILFAGIRVAPSIGRAIAEITGGVTNVKRWENKTDQDMHVYKFDHGDRGTRKDEYHIPAGQTVDGDMWIPWCNNAWEYPGSHAVIELGGRPFVYLYQMGSAIRWNVDDNFAPGGGWAVPGISQPGGDRTLGVAPSNGKFGFAIKGY